jgi:hypothetical protein
MASGGPCGKSFQKTDCGVVVVVLAVADADDVERLLAWLAEVKANRRKVAATNFMMT